MKETINKVKTQSTGWEKIFANHIQSKTNIHNNPEYLNKHLLKADIQMAKIHTEGFSGSLIIREMPIKTTRYLLTAAQNGYQQEISVG